MPTLSLDIFTLVAFLACAVVLLAVILLTGAEFTLRTVLFWFVASILVAPFARKLIVHIARRIHMAAIECLFTNLA